MKEAPEALKYTLVPNTMVLHGGTQQALGLTRAVRSKREGTEGIAGPLQQTWAPLTLGTGTRALSLTISFADLQGASRRIHRTRGSEQARCSIARALLLGRSLYRAQCRYIADEPFAHMRWNG